MRASILAIGDELTLGQKLDTNSAWLSAQLVAASVTPVEHRTVPDDRDALAEAIRELTADNDVLLITGGLGPTADDLTRDALGDVLTPGEPLVRDEDAVKRITRMFSGRGVTMPVSNLSQADRPASMTLMPNAVGTAPGIRGEHAGCAIFVLPGPPFEMHRMFEDHVAPELPTPEGDHRLLAETVHLYGLGESAAAERLGDMTDRDRDPRVGTTASRGVITARILATGRAEDARRRLRDTVEAVERLWAPYCFGRGDSNLSAATGQALRSAGATLVVAESCTGGQLGATLVDEAGASDFFHGGWVTYSNDMKATQLGVAQALLARHGAVSAPVAQAMAEGALRRSEATYGVAITGVAGPGRERDGGDDAGKPAGMVFIGLARRAASEAIVAIAREFRFRGDRTAVRDRSVKSALQMLRLTVLGHDDEPLLWERALETAVEKAGDA